MDMLCGVCVALYATIAVRVSTAVSRMSGTRVSAGVAGGWVPFQLFANQMRPLWNHECRLMTTVQGPGPL
eukprot:6490825-Prymnesium_polylepis.2